MTQIGKNMILNKQKMKNIFNFFAFASILFGCQKEVSNETTLTLASITTTPASAIDNNSALSGGNITNDGGDSIIQRGICWDTIHNPTKNNNHTTNGTGIGTFTSSITSLLPATTYYVRAYAVNSAGTAYGNEEHFTTTSVVVVIPTLITTSITELLSTSAKSGGNIISDGGAAVTTRGVCWGTTNNPTVALPTKTIDGSGSGNFISNITGLTANTTYFIRSYATNSAGTAYGNQLTFTTTAFTVYVAGNAEGATGSGQAMLWRNGIPTVLNNASNGASASSVFVSNNDVYVAGSESDPSNNTAKYWKNGIATTLPNSLGGSTSSIFVSAGDVYVTGTANTSLLNDAGILWKNGVSTILSNGALSSYPQSVYVEGGNAYVAGFDKDIIIGWDAKLWINSGAGTILSGNNNVAVAFSVFISGGNVYVVGYKSNGVNNVAMLWKNGIEIPLSNGNRSAYAQSVYVVGNDVYVAGYESRLINNVAMVWKNGVATDLSVGTNNAYANSVFVYNNDVYVAGQENNKAIVWKNGVATILSGSSPFASANSVFVK